jgi:hypothetical protein
MFHFLKHTKMSSATPSIASVVSDFSVPSEKNFVAGFRRAVKKHIPEKREYFDHIIEGIDKHIRDTRKFVYFHRNDLEQNVDYWLTVNPPEMARLFAVLGKVLKRNAYEISAMLSFPGFPIEDSSPDANLQRVIMYASLGFVMKSRTSNPEMPPIKALEYVHAALALRSGWGFGSYIADDKLSVVKNRVYFDAMSVLNVFAPAMWEIFKAQSGSTIVMHTSPGWVAPLIEGIATGIAVSQQDIISKLHTVAKAKDEEIYNLTNAYTQRSVEMEELTSALVNKDEELAQIARELSILKELQENARKQANDVADVVDICNRKMTRRAESMSSTLARQGERDLAKTTLKEAAVELKRSSHEIREMERASSTAQKALSAMSSRVEKELSEENAMAVASRAHDTAISFVVERLRASSGGPPSLPPRNRVPTAPATPPPRKEFAPFVIPTRVKRVSHVEPQSIRGVLADKILARRGPISRTASTFEDDQSEWDMSQGLHYSTNSGSRMGSSLSTGNKKSPQYVMSKENIARDFADIM